MERVQQDAKDRERRGLSRSAGIPIRRRAQIGTSDPLFRLGVPFHNEWTIRAGALRLRVPAYRGWTGAKATSDFYYSQIGNGQPGEHLALAIVNSSYVRASKSKYVNYYGLIWVPQETAFLSMNLPAFDEFKEDLRLQIVEERKKRVDREDFVDFQDYLDFKLGYDQRVEESVDGFLVMAMDEPDLIMYFSTSEFIFQTPRTEIRQPMIMTMTYALVRGKLLRIDFKRLYTSDEDAVQLISFSQQFVADMRTVNGLGERKIR